MSARSSPRPVALTAQAQADIEDIQVYTIQTWDAAQWEVYKAALTRALQLLADNPEIGRARDDLRPGYRTYLFERHIILCRLTSRRIVVSRIVHSKMNLRRALP